VTDTGKAAEVSESAEATETEATETEATEVSEEAETTEDAEVPEEAEAGTRSGTEEETEAAESPQQRARRELRERQERRRERREHLEQRERRLLLRSVALGFVAVVLGGLAAWFGVEAHSVTSSPTARNAALTDTAADAAVRSQITSAVNALFSYNYAKPGPTTQAASRLLTGAGTSQYSSVFGQVIQEGASEKLIITTAVTKVGVESLTGDQAHLLVFANTDQRVSGGQPQSGTAILAVNAVLQGGTWKIDGVTGY
jgi:Mce-associated membrane protein